ncbi:hypothetical protein LCGC14_1503380 [marine sediment metagenome]|uniref:Uncharacterized protein n=1 Tax=marine sediment metagenome TaxID=412755 RepID=A0A0F9M4U4_9ZZZZ
MGQKKVMDFPTPENFNDFFEEFITEFSEPRGGMMTIFETGPRENYSTVFETTMGNMEAELTITFDISGSKTAVRYRAKGKGYVGKMGAGMVGKTAKPLIKAAIYKVLKKK